MVHCSSRISIFFIKTRPVQSEDSDAAEPRMTSVVSGEDVVDTRSGYIVFVEMGKTGFCEVKGEVGVCEGVAAVDVRNVMMALLFVRSQTRIVLSAPHDTINSCLG